MYAWHFRTIGEEWSKIWYIFLILPMMQDRDFQDFEEFFCQVTNESIFNWTDLLGGGNDVWKMHETFSLRLPFEACEAWACRAETRCWLPGKHSVLDAFFLSILHGLHLCPPTGDKRNKSKCQLTILENRLKKKNLHPSTTKRELKCACSSKFTSWLHIGVQLLSFD